MPVVLYQSVLNMIREFKRYIRISYVIGDDSKRYW